jgi:Alpha/beta hydrolase family
MTHHRLLSLIAGLCVIGITSCRSVHQSHGRAAALGPALAQAESAVSGGTQRSGPALADAATVIQVVTAWQAQVAEPVANKPVTVQNAGQTWAVTASWPASLRFDELIPAPVREKRTPGKGVLRPGVGAPFVAHWEHTEARKKTEPFLSEVGYLVPVTVTLEFGERRAGARQVKLTVHDSRWHETAVVAGRRQPLAADFGSVGEVAMQLTKERGFGMSGLAAMTRSEKYLDKLGLFATEPPARDCIPLILVHGLMSRPITWHEAVSELSADPVIRKNYQPYFFRYPTGVPVVYSSAKFRAQLKVLHDELTRRGNHNGAHHMVLVGHSMGGLVSKMQLQDSGDHLWVTLFGAKPDELKLTPEQRAGFAEYLEFTPNDNVDRVIFICTPHRGSKLAVGIVGAVGRRLIKLPGRILGGTFDLLQGLAPGNSVASQLLAKGIPSSIDNLSPKSRFVQESTKIPLKPGVHLHSIVGNKNGWALDDPKCSDGVVPYTSAHIGGVESEYVVRSNHGAHERPEAIAEVRRILLVHLKTVPGFSASR